MERTGNCFENSTQTLIMDFSGFRTINDPKGFRSAGNINITRDIKGGLTVSLFW